MILQKAVLELLFDLMNIPQPDWTDDENAVLESVHSRFQESFKLNEGFLVSEGKQTLPSLSKTRFISFFTTLLLGRSRSGAPFRDIFSISVALSLGVVLELSNITPGGSEARVVGRKTRQNRDNKKKTNYKNHIIGSLSHPRIFY